MTEGFLLVVLGTALLPPGRPRRAGVLALLALGLAAAGLQAAPDGAPIGAGSSAAGSTGFRAVELALTALALGVGWVALAAARKHSAPSAKIGIGLVVAGLGWSAWGSRGLVAAAATATSWVALMAALGAGGALVFIGRKVAVRRAAPTRLVHWPLGAVAGLIVGTLAAALGPHLAVIFTGTALTAIAGHLLARSNSGSRMAIAPLVTAAALIPAYWLIATIAGPYGLAMAELPMLPLSPAAERALAPAILLAAWTVSGLWPFQRQEPGPLTAPAAAFLVARILVPVFPDGLEHWRPLAMPVAVVGLWHAAASRNWGLLAVGMAWVGLLAARPAGEVGAAALLVGALLAELAPGRYRSPLAERLVGALTALCWGAGGLLAVAAGLHAEVVYTVLGAAAVAVAVGAMNVPQAITASVPSTLAPRV